MDFSLEFCNKHEPWQKVERKLLINEIRWTQGKKCTMFPPCFLLRWLTNCKPDTTIHSSVELAVTLNWELTEGYTGPRAGVVVKRSKAAKWEMKVCLVYPKEKTSLEKLRRRVCVHLITQMTPQCSDWTELTEVGEVKGNRGEKRGIWEPELISEPPERCKVLCQLTCRLNANLRLALSLGAYI